MGYRTKDELEHFRWNDAGIYGIREENGHLVLELAYVTILGNNSCNRDIRDMGTRELQLKLYHISDREIIREGYKLYDADGNLKEKKEDEKISEEEVPAVYKELENGAIYAVEKDGQRYRFYLDTEERTYQMQVTAEHDIEEWEQFMRLRAD